MEWDGQEALEAAQLFKKGIEKGFAFFFNNLYYQLNCYSFQLLKDSVTAEDVIETAFMRLWEHRNQFDHPKVIKQWLYTTVFNESLNLMRKTKLRHSKINEISEQENILSDSIDEDIIKGEIYRKLYTNIETLPPSCKQVCLLFYIEQLTVKKICEKLNISESTVKTQRSRGIMLLRKKYSITKESIKAKEYRWVKSVFYDSKSSKRRSRLYGISPSVISLIRKGMLYQKTAKIFVIE